MVRLLIALSLVLRASSAFAASFDCGKASTPVEQTICASPRLSALDEELAATYAAARRSGGAAVRQAQKTWLAEDRRQCGDWPECIEASYLARIAELRLDHRALFAKQKPPAGIAGRYSELEKSCHPSEEDPNDNVCDEEVENFVAVTRGKGNALRVESELSFYNGHMCTVEQSEAEWVGGELRAALLAEDGKPQCVLVLRFGEEGVALADPAGRCKDFFCGARGSFDELVLPRKE